MNAPQVLRGLARWAARTLTQLTVIGIENVPPTGGVLLAMNHLGGADPVLVLGYCPRPPVIIGKSEILGWPVLGPVARAYGMLAVHRGEPDRATLQKAIAVLRSGQVLLIAPEGRESHTGALERAKEGAAFIAQHAAAPIVPVAITGTAWKHILPEWKHLRRPRVTVTFGAAFVLPPGLARRAAADFIMARLAKLLPPEYRGVYALPEW